MMRRRATRIGLAAAALLLIAAPARSQDTGSGAWAGSTLRVEGADPSTGSVPFTAYFTRANGVRRQIEIFASASGGPGGSCALPPSEVGAGPTPTSLSRTFRFECNGTYSITATARTTDVFADDSTTLSTGVPVSMPAPGVTGVNASGGGRAITVVWNDMRFAAKDLSGYVVERQVGDGEWKVVAEPGPDATTFVDEDLPETPGEATYRVSSTRPSPSGQLVSAASPTGATPFVGAPTPPSTGDGDGTTSPGDGTTGPGGTPGDGTAPPGTGTPGDPTAPGAPAPGAPAGPDAGPDAGPGGGRPTGGTVRAPRLGITGTFLPPLLRPSDAIAPPTTEEDGGFSDELPYDDVEPGEQEPVLPDDELASVFSEDSAGRGMAIPVATALVLAVWAFHLRFLARAAAQPGAHVAR